MKHGPIHLHIDELVLHGFDPADRHRLAEAVQSELASWLADQEWATTAVRERRSERIDAGELAVASLRAPTLGRQLAHAIGRSVTGAMETPDGGRTPGGQR